MHSEGPFHLRAIFEDDPECCEYDLLDAKERPMLEILRIHGESNSGEQWLADLQLLCKSAELKEMVVRQQEMLRRLQSHPSMNSTDLGNLLEDSEALLRSISDSPLDSLR